MIPHEASNKFHPSINLIFVASLSSEIFFSETITLEVCEGQITKFPDMNELFELFIVLSCKLLKYNFSLLW